MMTPARWLLLAGLSAQACTSASETPSPLQTPPLAASTGVSQGVAAGAAAGAPSANNLSADATASTPAGAAPAAGLPVAPGPVRDSAAVQALAKAPAPSESDIAKLLLSDAPNATADTIYVTLAHLATGSTGTSDLEVYRYGVTKALNNLSIKPTIALMTALDPGQTLYRIHLSDYSLNGGNWAAITGVSGANEAVTTIGSATVVRGDWLVYAVTRPEVYDSIMNVPNFVAGGNFGLPELESELNVDRSKSVYITVQHSEVTFDTRVLERVPVSLPNMPNGYYWRSYDFLSTADPVSKARGLADPTTLQAAVASSGNLVAGEMFFSLPNGLQGSMLSGFQRQHRIDAQSLVATDHNRPQDGLTTCVGTYQKCGYVINGESCMVCHANGIRISASITKVYGATQDQAIALMTQDLNRFTTALKSMGFASVTVEPIGATLARYRKDNQVNDSRQQGSEVNAVVNLSTIFGR